MAQVGLVLAGGGGKGAYQIGVWRALNEMGIRPDIISGSSVGALNGLMVCQGDLEKAERVWQTISLRSVMRFRAREAISLPLRVLATLSHRLTWRVPFESALNFAIVYLILSGVLIGIPSYFATRDNPERLDNVLILTFVLFVLPFVLVLLGPILDRLGITLVDNSPIRSMVDDIADLAKLSEGCARLFVTTAVVVPLFDPDNPRFDTDGREIRFRNEAVPIYNELQGKSLSHIKQLVVESASLPFGIFRAVYANGRFVVDGGLADNVPILPLAQIDCSRVIVVHLNHKGRDGKWRLRQPAQLAHRLAHLSRRQQLSLVDTGTEFARAYGGVAPTSEEWQRIREEGRQVEVIETDAPSVPVQVTHIVPSRRLGGFALGTLNFSSRKARRLISLGYSDAVASLK